MNGIFQNHGFVFGPWFLSHGHRWRADPTHDPHRFSTSAGLSQVLHLGAPTFHRGWWAFDSFPPSYRFSQHVAGYVG